MIAAGCAIALIAIDVLFFKIECMTALDGISPRMDATIGWSFEKPVNFLALLIGYSRLHVVLSAFLIPGFLVAWRRKQTTWLAIYLYFITSVIVSNLLITSRGYRFEYFLIPIWTLLCIQGMLESARMLIPRGPTITQPELLSSQDGWLWLSFLGVRGEFTHLTTLHCRRIQPAP